MNDINFDSHRIFFGDLLDHLRQNGFSIGVDSYLLFQEVLAKVSGRCSPDELKILLCPIVATNKKQQEFFYNAFDAYFDLTLAKEALQESPSRQRPPIKPQAEPVWASRWLYISIGLLLAIIIAGLSFYRERQIQIDQGIIPQSSPPITPTPEPGSLTTVVVYRPVPELIQPIRWLAFTIPFLWLLYEWYLSNRHKLLLNKLSSDYQPHIFPFRLDSPLPIIFTSEKFYNLARRLRRRQGSGFELLDINATVKTTIKFLGYPILRFKSASKPPEYLVLIERKTSRDTLSQFFNELIKALEHEGIHITRYYYEGDPRVCFKSSPLSVSTGTSLEEVGVIQSEQGVTLREVLNEHEDCRLLIFGSGEGLVNPLTGDMEKWTSLFGNLKERALLTPISPREWSFREITLANQFLLVPSSLDGMHALADYYEIGEGASLQRWIHNDPVHTPLDFDSSDVVRSLRGYLGEELFRWLCACAIYPSLQWSLTIYLGWLPSLRANLADEQNILRLIRLPWFREGSIPKQLRLLLINELSPELYNEARTAIIGILNEPEQIRGTVPDISSQINIAIPRVFPILSEAILRGTQAARAKGRIFRDYIFVRFLESGSNTLLNLILPRSLSKVFYPQGNTALRMRRGLRILTVLLVSIILWMTAPIIASAIKTEPTLTAQSITVSERPSPSPTVSPTVTASPVADITPGTTPQPQQTPTAVTGTPETSLTPQVTFTPGTGTLGNSQPPQPTPTVSISIATNSTPQPAGRQPTVFPTPEGSESTTSEQSGQSVLSFDMAPACPRVRIISDNLPAFTITNTLSQSLRAEANGGKILQSPRYIWSLQVNGSPASNNQGIVLAGQGNSSVNILWKVNKKESSKLTAKVVVTGYNLACATETSSTLQIIKPDDDGGCGCVSCGSFQCCPNPGYCLQCGSCGMACCNAQ